MKDKGLWEQFTDSPAATYSALGLVNNLLGQPKRDAMAQAQIAQTQYSPYLGIQAGNPVSAMGNSAFSDAMRGYAAGRIEDQKMNKEKELMELLKGGRKSASTPATTPTATPAVKPEETSPYKQPSVSHEIPMLLQRPDGRLDNYVEEHKRMNNSDDIIRQMIQSVNYGQPVSPIQRTVSPYSRPTGMSGRFQ